MLIKKNSNQDQKGQGIVEFALVLPVVLLIVFGVIELGYLLFTYSSVNSAAREAARYGIAVGNVGGAQRYYDCDGIVNAGLRIGSFAGMTDSEFAIAYDSGPDSTVNEYDSCADLVSYRASHGSDSISFGDRIKVTVNHTYNPLISYMGLNIGPFNMSSTSSRTIVKGAEVVPGGGGSGGGSGGGGGGGGGGAATCNDGEYNVLTLDFNGSGSTPVASPAKSDACNSDGQYLPGEPITITGQPALGYYVDGWTNAVFSGTDITTIDMPATPLTVTANYTNAVATCHTLSLTAIGDGTLTASPAKSDACTTDGTYLESTTVTLTAAPNINNVVSAWSGTQDDFSTANTNYVTVPAGGTSASVTFTGVICYTLTLSHTGSGADPVASPTNSNGCATGEFVEGQWITVTASPNLGSEVADWIGTANPTSTAVVNSVQMPGSNHTVTVDYVVVEVKDPPINPSVTFSWNNGQQECSNIDFSWQDPGWTTAPVGFRVFLNGLYYGQITGMTWDASATAQNLTETITFGVQAVFVQDLEYSQTLSVTYLCSNGNMINQGEVIK